MNKKSIYFICLFIFLGLQLLPWGAATHKTLVDQSVFKSIPLGSTAETWLKKFNLDRGFFYKYFNFNNEQYDLIQMIDKGAEFEDNWVDPLTMRRSDNHFHNPLLAFASAGLNDIASGLSLAVWAQDGPFQDPYPEKDQSWKKVRDYYYNALLADNGNDKNTNLGKMFKGIGHQIHLVQDAAVPDHVRNDTHALNGDPTGLTNKKYGSFRCIEGWADWNINLIYNFSNNPIFPNTHFNHILYTTAIPISNLIDSNYYDGTSPSTSSEQGLAEYTNANFISENTICTDYLPPDHKHYFPFPKFSDTDIEKVRNGEKEPEYITAFDNKKDYVRYIKKEKNGESINHFLKLGYFSWAFPLILEKTVIVDNLCHKDFSSMLIPRAVGYSAALINYFFRGEMEISLPEEEGIYGFAPYPEEGFKKITLMVKNITQNENMVNGKLSLVIRYRNFSAGGEFDGLDLPRPDEEQKFIMVDYKDLVTLNYNEQKKFTFELSQPLPVNVADVTLTVVFKGDLGGELGDAVAIGFKDISEPTVIEVYNDTDKVCFNGAVVDYTDPALLNYADIGHDGVISNNDVDIIPRTVRLGDVLFRENILVDKTTNTYFNFIKNRDTFIEPGNQHRIYVLTDEDKSFYFSFLIGNKRSENSQVPYTPPWTLPYYDCKYVFSDFYFWIYNQHIPVNPNQLAPRVNKLIWNPATQKFDHFNFQNHSWASKNKYFWNLFYYSQPDNPNPCTCTGCDVYKPTPAQEFKAFHYPSVVIVDYFDAQ